jgi:hypothetical protein
MAQESHEAPRFVAFFCGEGGRREQRGKLERAKGSNLARSAFARRASKRLEGSLKPSTVGDLKKEI